ncbi:MAG: sulfatase [Candidatus Saccharimonas sp.]|nr:sulfatase [Planctomycetaceae bacterium]
MKFRWTTMRVLLAGLLLAAVTLTAAQAQEAKPRPNVLFVAVDDLRPELGCYGVSQVKTPHIDRLAAAGVKFDRAYCQFPLCNPSRSSMLTGRHPHTTGVLDNTVWFKEAHPDWVSLPQHFQQNGYVSARVGKIFHGGIDDTDAWSVGGDPRKPVATKKPGQQAGQSDRIVELDGEGESHADFKTAARAIELLNELKAKPFFLAVGFTKPHSPPTAPKKMFAMYDPAKIPLPPDFAKLPTVPEGFPAASVPPRSSDLFIGREASPEAAREMIRAYHASLTFTDTNVGKVLDELDRLGLAKNTVVVFFGDHGYHLGEKGKWSKHGSLFEIGTRVPLIVRWPGAAGNGKTSGRTVQLLDVYPTLVELCGLPAASGQQGHSLAPLLRDPGASWSHPAFTLAGGGNRIGHSIRTERWRYTEWNNGEAGAVLFDHQADPHEIQNLAADAAHAQTIAELKRQLHERYAQP